MSSDVEQAEEVELDEKQAKDMSRALKWGIGLGTPVTILVFFAILMLAGVGVERSAIASVWTGIVGGAFYGGISAMLHVMNKYH